MASRSKGDEYVAEARKCLKTSLLKWSPDYEGAANAFGKAALAYRNSRALEKSKEMFIQAAECHYKHGSIFHSAKALEDAGSVAKELKSFEEVVKFWEKACERYCDSDAASTGFLVLENTAKLLETVNCKKSADTYMKVAQLGKETRSSHDNMKALRNASNMYIKAEMYDKALETCLKYRSSVESHGSAIPQQSAVVMQVGLLIKLGQLKQAERSLQDAYMYPSFPESKEAALLEDMLEALRSGDTEEFEKCCNSSLVKTLDNAVVKLIRSLPSSALESTSFLDDDDDDADQKLEDVPSLRAARQYHPPPRTALDDMRDELFSTSASKAPSQPTVEVSTSSNDEGILEPHSNAEITSPEGEIPNEKEGDETEEIGLDQDIN